MRLSRSSQGRDPLTQDDILNAHKILFEAVRRFIHWAGGDRPRECQPKRVRYAAG
jgi:hypothetical protein